MVGLRELGFDVRAKRGVMAALDPAIHVLFARQGSRGCPGHPRSSRGQAPGHDEGGFEPYAASTSTSSESSSAVILSRASSRIATPSRALTRTPLISTAPAAGTR